MYLILYWSVVCTLRLWPRRVVIVPLLLGAVILTAHWYGYKLYGSATVVNTGPVLGNGQLIRDFEMPNVVVAEDGSRYTLPGVRFRAEFGELPAEEKWASIPLNRDSARVAPSSESPSGFLVEYPRGATCGNTYFPTLLPERIPSHVQGDLGAYLRGLSEPSGDE